VGKRKEVLQENPTNSLNLSRILSGNEQTFDNLE
jgi:hypothetical protein